MGQPSLRGMRTRHGVSQGHALHRHMPVAETLRLALAMDGVAERVNAEAGAEHARLEAGRAVGLPVDPSRALAFDPTGALLP